jgi:hypothetical protein
LTNACIPRVLRLNTLVDLQIQRPRSTSTA